MNHETLKEATILLKIIETTKKTLSEIKLNERERSTNVNKDNKFDDGRYQLCICEFGDGSGWNCKLNRYKGNDELINVIIKTLERQLKEFEEEFANL